MTECGQCQRFSGTYIVFGRRRLPFGTEDQAFWCCTGSGMEEFSKYVRLGKPVGTQIPRQYQPPVDECPHTGMMVS